MLIESIFGPLLLKPAHCANAIERRFATFERNMEALARRAESVACALLSRFAPLSAMLATTASHWFGPNASAAHSARHGDSDGGDESDPDQDATADPAGALTISVGGR
jgi:hypothetical protein